ncbi:hypothetical protein D6783_03455 [Candidatus Woesearchaeota archaeon]|nr:MAG: hypothetical protein D6783_03455 [Candidatus Woesearchaeota archaeon]
MGQSRSSSSLNLPKREGIEVPARFWKRMLAFLLDLFFLRLFVLAPFSSLFEQRASTSLLMEESLPAPVMAGAFIVVLLVWLYFTMFQFVLKQTPGMMIAGLWVRGRVGLVKAAVRNLFILPVFPFFILWIVEPVHLLLKKVRWLEVVTETRTVEVFRA